MKEVNILGLKCLLDENGAIRAELFPGDSLYDEFKALFNADIPIEHARHFSAITHTVTDFLLLRIDLYIN